MLPDYQGPSITLFNFEEPFAENSKYVLTSPRSLKACQVVGVKPVQLLCKPLSEFENEYNGRLSYDLILERFQKHEQRRLGLLRRCRDERSKIVDDEQKVRRKSVTEKRTGRIVDFLGSDSEREDFDLGLSKSSFKDQMAGSSNSEFQTVEDSYKRNTARRSLSGRDLTRSSKSSPYSPRSPRPVSKQASGYFDSTSGSPAKLDSDFWRSLTESRPYVAKESAVQRHGWNDEYLKPRSPILFRSQSPQPQRNNRKMRRTLSVDNIISDLPAHIQKQAMKLSENDQKIFNIMISKANREEVEKRLQAAKELESAEERKVENELKQMKEKRHQMHLADRMRKSQELRELHKRRLTEQIEERQRYLESEIRFKNDYWLKTNLKLLESKSDEITMKTMQRDERKRLQEENLARASEEKEYLRSMTHTGLINRHENAARTKEIQVRLAKSKQAMKNLEERERHKMKMEETTRRLREDQMALQYAMESKHRRAEMNNRYAEREKDYTMAANKMRDQRKKEQQEESLRKIQNDMELWQKELQKYQSENEERAIEIAKKNSYLKGKKAMMDRLQKEQEHLLNKQKIRQDEKARLAELENSVKEKEIKSQMILDEKKYATKASREVALASRAIREVIKEKAVKSSFDKMANEAEMLARIERKGFQR